MESTDYTVYLHDTPANVAAHNDLELDADDDDDEQVDSGGDGNDVDGMDDDEYPDLPGDAPAAKDDEDEADVDPTGFAQNVSNSTQASMSPSSQFTYTSGVALPYAMLAPAFVNPYFFTPPHHNPYSPTGGAGHLHPPAISQNPYHPMAAATLSQPPPPTPAATGAQAAGPSSASTTATRYDSGNVGVVAMLYINGDVSPIEPPPAKRARRTNADVEADLLNRSIDELYTELPPPPTIDDPDPGRPFARPDALRRHKERGHCGLQPPTDSKQSQDANGSPSAQAQTSDAQGTSPDPAWSEGQPSPLDIAVAAATNAGAVQYTAEQHAQLMDLTRQLEEANAAAGGSAGLTLPTGQEDVGNADGQTATSGTGKEKGPPSPGKKVKRKVTRTSKKVKSSALVDDEDDSDIVDSPEVIAALAAIGHPAASKHPTASEQPPNIYQNSLGGPFPNPTTLTVEQSQFLSFLQPLATQGATGPSHPQQHPANTLQQVSFGPTATGAPFPVGFIPGQAPYTYTPNHGFTMAGPHNPLGGISLPNATSAAIPSQATFTPTFTQTPNNSTSGTLSRPTATPSGPLAFSYSPNGPISNGGSPSGGGPSVAASSKNTNSGKSLVELAVGAATRAQQKQQQEQAQAQARARAQAEAERQARSRRVDVSNGPGGTRSLGGTTTSDNLDLDMGMDLLHASGDDIPDVVVDAAPTDTTRNELDGAGLIVGEEDAVVSLDSTAATATPGKPANKKKTKTAKNVSPLKAPAAGGGGATRSRARTRAKVVAPG
ncbi:hypothetical protein FRB99_004855 [Tulasnella sp. 403]|nr:hypothetical protein FRB99_004855 [Tulasnella sp. 403]